MRLAQTNIRGLNPTKIQFIQEIIQSFQLDIVCITESHLLDIIKDSSVSIPHFNLYRSDSDSSTYKHGVCAYVQEDLHVDNVVAPMPNLLSFHLSRFNVHIVVVYRPPSYSPDSNSDLLQHLYTLCEGKEVIVVGDFNLPALDWSPESKTASYPPLDRSFLNVFNSLGLRQWVHEATFPSSGNILDLVLTSEDDRIGQIQIPPPLPGCDHCPTVVEYVFSADDASLVPTQDPPPRRAWHKGKYNKIRSILCDTDWKTTFEGLSASECFDLFTNQVKTLCEELVPLKPAGSDKPPWPTRPPTSLVHERQRAWSTFKAVKHRLGNRSPEVSVAYKAFADINTRFRNFAVHSQSKYEEGLIAKSKENPKLLHSHIRHKKVGRSSAGPVRLPSGVLCDDPTRMSECFAEAFASVYASQSPANPHPHHIFPGSLAPLVITRDHVLSLLRGLDPHSSMGPDGLHPHMLKQCADAVATPLHLIFKRSYEEGEVPSLWKTSRVIPIFKKGSRYDPLNYRPISLTSVCCKLMERAIATHIWEYLDKNDIITANQFGFRAGRSTADQLLLVYNDVSRAIDEGQISDVVLFDFSKAFDVVPHDILLEKLRCLGFGGDHHESATVHPDEASGASLLSWIQSFLLGRSMQVSVNGANSSLHQVQSGVPQGSVLGPILFIIFINSIASCLSSSYKIFADDLKIYASFSRNQHNPPHPCAAFPQIQSDIDLLYATAKSWGLQMNRKKCVVLRFYPLRIHDPPPSPVYLLDGQPIPSADSCVDLGVKVDVTMRFHAHIRDVTNKAGGLAQNFLKSTVCRTPEFMMFLWKTHIRPIIDYCSIIWNTGYLEDLRLLEGVQRRWTKAIAGLDHLSYADRLARLNLFSVQGRLLRADLIQYWKIINNKSCIPPSSLFMLHPNPTPRGHPLNILTPHTSTDTRQRSFSYRRIRIWNRLPSEAVCANNLRSFKKSLEDNLKDELYAYTD